MNPISSPLAGTATNVPLSSVSDRASRAGRIYLAAGQFLAFLERGQAVGSNALSDIMTRTFEGTDAEGFWLWKDAYEELSGFSEGMRGWLKSIGLFLEIISWKTRMVVPMTTEGSAILAKLMERYQQVDVAGRT